MTKSEFIKGITRAQKYLQEKYEENDLTFEGCCAAINESFYTWYVCDKLVDGIETITSNRCRCGYYLGQFTDENLFKRMMVLECLMEEMLKDGSYKEL